MQKDTVQELLEDVQLILMNGHGWLLWFTSKDLGLASIVEQRSFLITMLSLQLIALNHLTKMTFLSSLENMTLTRMVRLVMKHSQLLQ